MLLRQRLSLLATACFFEIVASREGCHESSSWYKKADPSKSCEWVSKHRPRCVVRGEDGSWAFESCELSCGTCPTECGRDDSEWMTASGLGGCDWVQEFRKGRCDNIGIDGTYAFATCPVACRTCFVEGCSDDERWITPEGYTCDWVNEASKNRCSWLGLDGIHAFKACRAACDTCTFSCESEDSEDFHKRGDPDKGCSWVEQRHMPRCIAKGEDGGLAYEHCPVACKLTPSDCAGGGNDPTRTPTSRDMSSSQPSNENAKATSSPTYLPTPVSSTNSPSYSPSGTPKTKGPSYSPTLVVATIAPVHTPTDRVNTTIPSYVPTYAPTTSNRVGSPRLLSYVNTRVLSRVECDSEVAEELKVGESDGSWSDLRYPSTGYYLLIARMQLSQPRRSLKPGFAIGASRRWGHVLDPSGSWGQSILAVPEFFESGDRVSMTVSDDFGYYGFETFSSVIGSYVNDCDWEGSCDVYGKQSSFFSFSSAFYVADATFYSVTILDDTTSSSSVILTSDDKVPRDGVYWVSARVTALGKESESLIVEVAVDGVPTGYGINVVMRGDEEEVVGDVALAISLPAGARLSLVDSGSEGSFEAKKSDNDCLSSLGKTFITLLDLPNAIDYGTAFVGSDSYETSVGERLYFDQRRGSSSLLDEDGTTFTARTSGMHVASLRVSLDGTEEKTYAASFEINVNGVGSGFALEILAPEIGQFQFQQQLLVTPPLYLRKGDFVEVVTTSTRAGGFKVNGRSGDNDEYDTFFHVVLIEQVERDDDNCDVPDSKRHFLGDGYCDDQSPYNTKECGYDGGDCCSSTCASGDIYVCGLGDRDACVDPDATHNPDSYPERCDYGDCFCDCDCDNGVENGCTDRRRLEAVEIDLQ